MEYYYTTDVNWDREHWGKITMGNGPEMKFSAPPDAHGYHGVLTPEDAFVGAVNMCFMMMFIWACERFKVDLVNYACHAEGVKEIFLNKTEKFTRVILKPDIEVKGISVDKIEKIIKTAQKYSLVANSISGELIINPDIKIIS